MSTPKKRKELSGTLLATKSAPAPAAATAGVQQRSSAIDDAVAPFNFKVPPSFIAAFRRYAFETNRKQSQMIQDAFEALMEKEGHPVNHADVNGWRKI